MIYDLNSPQLLKHLHTELNAPSLVLPFSLQDNLNNPKKGNPSEVYRIPVRTIKTFAVCFSVFVIKFLAFKLV